MMAPLRGHSRRDTLRWNPALLISLFTLLWTLAVFAPFPARADYDDDLGIGVAEFWDGLEPYGEWFEYGDYGWVWRPYDVPPGWQPYTVGHWVWSDVGWVWISEEPWGWAPYHYGRWFFADDYGWSWVPGRRWAPAWVAWRRGDGWIGWAPLPPWARWRADYGIGRDVYLEPRHFCFVEERHIVEPHLVRYIAPRERIAPIIYRTRDVTNYALRGDRIVNQSVRADELERVIGRHLRQHRVEEFKQAAPRPLHVRSAPPPKIERRERERVERQRHERESVEQRNVEKQDRGRKRLEQRDVEREQREREGLEQRKMEGEQRQRERQDQERIDQEKRQRERVERNERQQRDKVQREERQRERLEGRDRERHGPRQGQSEELRPREGERQRDGKEAPPERIRTGPSIERGAKRGRPMAEVPPPETQRAPALQPPHPGGRPGGESREQMREDGKGARHTKHPHEAGARD